MASYDSDDVLQASLEKRGYKIITTASGVVVAINNYKSPELLNLAEAEQFVAAVEEEKAAPLVADFSPLLGAAAGGDTITINGTNLEDVDSVEFDGTPGTSLTHVTDEQITVVTPAHNAGAVDVVVKSPFGDQTLETQFTYHDAPTISNLNPIGGGTAGGTTVTITGTNFIDGETTVTFDGDLATNLVFTSDTSIDVDSPAHSAGAVDVVVTTPGGQDTDASGYTYS